MAYRALYRVYRPSLFGEVAGQDHVTAVLKNQVQQGRLSHAYLFCGPRGTGKTSTAKILARAANCLHPVCGEPCGECDMCKAAARANSDIVEIDAASNNGVDNVRDLISQAQFAPLELKKRVFIIDEVHMLSTSAFNALLKTLEEPPEHILFILATTEPQKMLATIVSRCQRFDFRHIRLADIVSYMQKVVEKEGVSAETDALRAVAHAAGGGMRDALSLLNQCLSVSGSKLTMQDVREVLGSVEEDFLFNLTACILAGDGKGCLAAVEEIVRQGRDLSVFTNDLSQHMRSLLLTDACGRCADLLECTEETALRYEKQAKETSRDMLLYIAEQLISARADMKYYPNPRFLLETALLRMASPSGDNSRSAVLARLDALENRNETALSAKLSVLENELKSLKDSLASGNIHGNSPAGSAVESVFTDKCIVNNKMREDVPPWDDFIPEPPPEESSLSGVEEATVEAAVVQNPAYREASPTPKKAKTAADVPDDSDTGLLRQLREAMMKANPMIGMTLKSIDGVRIDGTRFSLLYSHEQAGKATLLNRPGTLRALQQEIDKLRPGLTVSLSEREEDSTPGINKIKQLFGDKLIME